jgi:hypothetical protein
VLTLELGGDRHVVTQTCDCCGDTRQTVTGYVYDDDTAHAVYFASCCPHDREVWIEVILGSWDVDSTDDHITFGCRVGDNEQAELITSLVPAAQVSSNNAIYGQKLDRDQALVHPWLDAFWDIVDLVMLTDPTVHQHVYGPEHAPAQWS